jgi:hypothetical protein
MVWFVAIVAVLNLALGYLLAVFFGVGRSPIALAAVDPSETDEVEQY